MELFTGKKQNEISSVQGNCAFAPAWLVYIEGGLNIMGKPQKPAHWNEMNTKLVNNAEIVLFGIK